MSQILKLIDETAKELAKVTDPERRKVLKDEIQAYALAYCQIIIMRADKEYKSEHN